MLEKKNRVNYLFDFYGGLLTEKQRAAVEMYYKEDFTLAEIAADLNISRQAVFDLLSRSVATLEDWEQELLLYDSYLKRKENGARALELLSQPKLEGSDLEKLKNLVKLIMES